MRGAAPSYEECVGYRIPLFLGGKDVMDNLETSNLDVYWTLMAQLIRKARGLPIGTVFGKITSVDGTLPE
ncbi:T6SS immunity protein Tdi1 domain-containing protein, partial [Caballeronia zhejiangensis]|uniref:T6SS immunity protein Tdi1 domain-containing protein n=1 Tax=Caballeronia zhejiangensis TaxID=871203 RepID=UPI002409471E